MRRRAERWATLHTVVSNPNHPPPTHTFFCTHTLQLVVCDDHAIPSSLADENHIYGMFKLTNNNAKPGLK